MREYDEKDPANPSHYRQQDEETIDKIRRYFQEKYGNDGLRSDFADWEIALIGFCDGNVIKYGDRAPHKGQAESDSAKIGWYDKMLDHIMLETPDPRDER